MLSKTMEAALNKQMELESYASFLYLSMASWCDQKAMEGCTHFMERQSEEERQHMMRLFRYINEMDGHALVPAVKEPPHDFGNIRSMFEQVYQHEQKVTASIHGLVELSQQEKDPTTYNFLQWYVDEQREEEALMRTILDRIKLIGEGPQTLYYIDKEVEKINQAEIAAAAAAGGGE